MCFLLEPVFTRDKRRLPNFIDEPDASLDIFRQEELIETYKNTFKSAIRIFITHKVNYAKEMGEKIYVLEKGEILESGSHTELLNDKGKYYKMFNACQRK